ncbi:hypothetical protein B4065_0203 [Caldibacillus thermoamylovorans]|nr:hypothetical protein B4065_0203 [Caldibacillus thermoamylovorans]
MRYRCVKTKQIIETLAKSVIYVDLIIPRQDDPENDIYI